MGGVTDEWRKGEGRVTTVTFRRRRPDGLEDRNKWRERRGLPPPPAMSTLLHPALPETECYTLRLAADAADVRAAQALRFRVFNLELNEGLVESYATGRDEDAFDAVCAHLLVVERRSGEVVGTYRMQTGTVASLRSGYYGEQEFDFGPFERHRARMLELGRACVAAAHRNQTVLALLWRGIFTFARERGLRYLVGCSSITSRDEAGALVTFAGLRQRFLAEPGWRTEPRAHCRCRPAPTEPLAVPRLMVAYLAAGARICGEPAVDRDFGTIDFLTVLDLETVSPRFARKYLA